MKPSENCIELIKGFEDCKLIAYRDGGGVLSIGYGSTENVTDGMTITLLEADNRLRNKLTIISNALSKLVCVPLSQNQFDALCSFIYNVGIHAFERSTMRTMINNGLFASAAAQFKFWCMDNGKRIPGLVKRRFFERQLFEKI